MLRTYIDMIRNVWNAVIWSIRPKTRVWIVDESVGLEPLYCTQMDDVECCDGCSMAKINQCCMFQRSNDVLVLAMSTYVFELLQRCSDHEQDFI